LTSVNSTQLNLTILSHETVRLRMPYDRYQTVQELAERLEVAEATVRRWIKSGELRAIDIGKGWRIAESDLARFLEARETTPRADASKAWVR
jgi:excisionase family DNA binding protein